VAHGGQKLALQAVRPFDLLISRGEFLVQQRQFGCAFSDPQFEILIELLDPFFRLRAADSGSHEAGHRL